MNKVYISLVLLLACCQLTAQQIDRRDKLNKPSPVYYEQRMKQRSLLGGFALASGTILYFVGRNQLYQKNGLDKTLGGVVLAGTGLVIAAGSIPLFISAIHYNRKFKEVSAGLGMEHSSCIRQAVVSRLSYPVLSIRIGF